MDSNLLGRIANPEVANPAQSYFTGAQQGNALAGLTAARTGGNLLASGDLQGATNAALQAGQPDVAAKLAETSGAVSKATMMQGIQQVSQAAQSPEAWDQFRKLGISKGHDVGGFENAPKIVADAQKRYADAIDPVAAAARNQQASQFQQTLNKPTIESQIDPLTGEKTFVRVAPFGGQAQPVAVAGASAPAVTPAPAQAAQAAGGAALAPEVEASIAKLPSAYAPVVRGILDYSVDPRSLPIKARAALLGTAQTIDPTYNASNYPARASAIKDATSGKMAQANNSLNTGIGHLDQLVDAVAGLNNGDFTPFNAAKNTIATIKGDPSVTNFKAVADRVAPEITRIWRGVGGNEADIARDLTTLSTAASPQQLYGAIGNIAKMMQSKIDSNQFQYEQAVPGRTIQMIKPEAEAVIAKLEALANPPAKGAAAAAAPGGDQIQAGSQGNPLKVDNIEYARGLPPGTFFTTPDGRTKVR